jgi:NADP-dependent 3-hydroxy acid dehydrogenase YdfG
VAWITGASSGIGRASAVELARRGATVAVSARREDRLAELVAVLGRTGVRAMAAACDVCDERHVRSAVGAVVGELGRLDIVLANAGRSVSGTIEELSADDWRRQLDVNVVGAALTARHAIPHLRDSRGRLAFTGSVAGFMVAPGYGAYHASKYALRALGRTLSAELAGTGVSCTTIHPGFVKSEIMKVDNDGGVVDAREDVRPSLLMWSAEDAARVMVDAIVARRRELVFTGHGKIAAWLGIHFPSAMHAVMTLEPMIARAQSFRQDG